MIQCLHPIDCLIHICTLCSAYSRLFRGFQGFSKMFKAFRLFWSFSRIFKVFEGFLMFSKMSRFINILRVFSRSLKVIQGFPGFEFFWGCRWKFYFLFDQIIQSPCKVCITNSWTYEMLKERDKRNSSWSAALSRNNHKNTHFLMKKVK